MKSSINLTPAKILKLFFHYIFDFIAYIFKFIISLMFNRDDSINDIYDFNESPADEYKRFCIKLTKKKHEEEKLENAIKLRKDANKIRELVQDSYSKVYFLKEQAFILNIDGQVYYFSSLKNKNLYIEQKNAKKYMH